MACALLSAMAKVLSYIHTCVVSSNARREADARIRSALRHEEHGHRGCGSLSKAVKEPDMHSTSAFRQSLLGKISRRKGKLEKSRSCSNTLLFSSASYRLSLRNTILFPLCGIIRVAVHFGRLPDINSAGHPIESPMRSVI